MMLNLPQVGLLSLVLGFSGLQPGVALAAQSPNGSATLSWYPPTENADGSNMANLAGYRIYYGKNAKRLNLKIAIGNPGLTRFVVEDLEPARWHFAMTSVNASGEESKRSQTVSKLVR